MLRTVNGTVREEVARLIADGGRGTATRLARHLGVSNATVSKWTNGQTNPDPDHWPGIEAFFDLPAGALSQLSSEGARWQHRLDRLQAQLAQIQQELCELRRLLPPSD